MAAVVIRRGQQWRNGRDLWTAGCVLEMGDTAARLLNLAGITRPASYDEAQNAVPVNPPPAPDPQTRDDRD